MVFHTVVAERSLAASRAFLIRSYASSSSTRELKSALHNADRSPPPSLLPVLRSQQQGEILALLLGDPSLELSLTQLAARIGVPHPSVFREIHAERR